MRAFIKNYLGAEKARREEEGEKGFSLIELIIVVVILGILVAVAIPIFANIQTTARHNALSAAAANGATAVAAAIANNKAAADVTAAAASAGTPPAITVTIATTPAGSTSDASAICVRATNNETTPEWAQAGTLTACNSDSW
ncbi:type II secretion system protein [Microbacterium sp. QXD-8]|uniref:Type II secretion system protein n=1 Tax=Microbacterium psychrotolerans TaxID=3068321 RepID=A0ABU0Z2N8_9MICO|nr:type II secretion system protein [Microbacterium sp. QXD-8]MDQ7878096.1 type II secretion system protein [Microbacterium sp. QXD-8]